MKILSIHCALIGIFISSSCEKKHPQTSPGLPNSPVPETEAQLIEKKRRMVSASSEQRDRMEVLKSEIQQARKQCDDLKLKMEFLESVKKQINEDFMELKKRLDKEAEGIHTDSVPIREYLRDLKVEMDRLLQENEDLKRKLDAFEDS